MQSTIGTYTIRKATTTTPRSAVNTSIHGFSVRRYLSPATKKNAEANSAPVSANTRCSCTTCTGSQANTTAAKIAIQGLTVKNRISIHASNHAVSAPIAICKTTIARREWNGSAKTRTR